MNNLIVKVLLVTLLFSPLFFSCRNDDLLDENGSEVNGDERTILYGIKDGDNYGYIDGTGKIVLDKLSNALIGELKGDKTYEKNITYEIDSSGFLPVHNYVFTWKCYYRDGTVTDVTGDYEYDRSSDHPYGYVGPLYEFFEERAIVSMGSTTATIYGFVDENCVEVIPCQFNWVSNFSDGVAAVVDENYLLGYVDELGNYIIEPQYKIDMFQCAGFSRRFYDGKAIVFNPDEGILVIDKSNNIVADLSNLNASVDAGAFISDNLICMGKLNYQGRKLYGYAGIDGQWKIEPQFKKAGNFYNGLAWVQEAQDPYLYYYIDKSGNKAFDTGFSIAFDFDKNGLACVAKAGMVSDPFFTQTYTFIDKSGNDAFPFEFSMRNFNQRHFVNGLFLIPGEWRYINNSGSTVLELDAAPYLYDNFDYPYNYGSSSGTFNGTFNKEGVARIRFSDNNWGYINKQGDLLWKSSEPLYIE